MALTEKQKDAIKVAIANVDEANALIVEIDKVAAAGALTALGTTSNLTALVIAATTVSDLSTGDTYADAGLNAIFAEVETALDLKADNADVETLRGEIEVRLDAIEAKVDAIIAAMA